MIYCQTINRESIAVHSLDDIDNTQYVELIKYGDAPMFAVYMDDGEDKWVWEFELDTPSNYERVKMNVFDAIFGCETMIELAEALDSIFENDFEDILIRDESDACEGCEECKECENRDECFPALREI